MRKVSFMLILAFASMIVGAQTTEYKLGKGDVTTELQMSLFSTNAQLHLEDDYEETVSYSAAGPLSLSGFRLRYALSEKFAIRATIGLDFGHHAKKQSFDNDTTEDYVSMSILNGKMTDKSRYTQFSIAPGFEYHFGNWERMSVYVAGELFFGMKTTTGISEEDLTTELYERDWYTGDYKYLGKSDMQSTFKTKNCEQTGYGYNPSYSQRGLLLFGASVSLGMDFYVYKGLYLGAELGLGYTYASALKGSVTGDTTIDGVVGDKIDIKLKDKISDGNLGFRCNPMIRIGWKF